MAKAKIKVNIENKQKTVTVPTGIRLLIRRCCQAVLQEEALPYQAEVDVSFVDNEQIRQINRDGTTILLVEQNTNVALSVCNRGYVLENGEIILSDKADNLMENDMVRMSYLGEG